MKLIVLDRDGVINMGTGTFIASPDEWMPIPGSVEAVARLNHAGYRVVVTTHQPEIARGLLSIETLNLIHQKMHRMIQEVGGLIDAVFFCPDVETASTGRKPHAGNPNLLLDISQRIQRSLQGVPVVSDSLRDVQAARMLAAWPMLVRTGKGALAIEQTPEQYTDVLIFDDLAAVADYLTRPSE